MAHDHGTFDMPSRALRVAVALTGSGVAWQQYLHGRMGQHELMEPGALAHWARDGGLALPAVLVAVVVCLTAVDRLLRRHPAGSPVQARATRAAGAALAAASVLALGAPVHEWLFASSHPHGHELPVILHVLRDGLLSLPVTLVVALAVLLPQVHVDRRRVTARVVVLALLAAPLAVTASASPAGAGANANGPCPAGSRDIVYDLAAFENEIPVNGWGDHLPDGLQYALKNAGARSGKADIVQNANLSAPLVVRANVGDCITVKLRNDIAGRRVGIHPDGLVQFDPKTSDGARVGNNPDTTAATGEERSYTWYADRVGEAPLLDVANLADAGEDGTGPESTVQLGLYGGIVVHPKGSTWHDPVTGASLLGADFTALQSALFADVRVPGGVSYRSFAMVFMDENEDIVNRDGAQPTFPGTGNPDSTFGINYRSEPLRNRLQAIEDYRAGKVITLPNGKRFDPAKVTDPDPAVASANHFCDGYVPELKKVVDDPGAKCLSEESHLQSWVFGDEGKLTRTLSDGTVVTDSDNLIPKAYKGDKIRFHIIHPGAKETHPWHQHTQRWRSDPDGANAASSPHKDVQSVSPGEAFPLEIEGGAGGSQGTVGDSIFHCHLYPHFAQGFWGH
jgi:hypothetical protein